jgi:hypothetical protein
LEIDTDSDGTVDETVTLANAVAGEAAPAPTGLALTVAPNPVRGSARLGLSLDTPDTVRLSLHDALGREVAVLANGPRAAGEHEVDVDLTGLPAGVYLLRLGTEAGTLARPLTVVR